MRPFRRWLLALAAVTGAAVLPAGGAGAAVLTRDTEVWGVWALRDTVLYGRESEDRRWMRVIDGRRSRAGIPDGYGVRSLGRDARGRIVAVLEGAAGSRLYDVAANRMRPSPLRSRSGCRFARFSVWRGRTAYAAYCGGSAYSVRLREGGRDRRVASIRHDNDGPSVLLRGRSLLADGIAHDESHRLWSVLDRGRRCFGVADTVDAHDDWNRGAFGIAGGQILWALGQAQEFPGGEWGMADLTVMSARLRDVCGAGPQHRLVAFDVADAPVRAVALDRRTLYYSTPAALHRVQLPRTATASPPANDDADDAREIAVPGETVARTGHATLEPGEDPLFESRRTVWFRFRAERTQRLLVTVWGAPAFRVYAGEREIATSPRFGFEIPVDVVGGTEYRVQVGSWSPFPTYQPFHLMVREG